jgi:glycosyltransferase involved in cell wall biosynthesis
MHVIAPAPFGGAERVVRDLVVSQRSLGMQVSAALILETGAQQTWLEGALEKAGAPYRALRFPTRAYQGIVRALRSLVHEESPDIVHTHGYRADVLARAALPRGVRHVITAHGFTSGGRKNRIYEWIDRWVMKRVDAVIAVSAPLAQLLERRGIPAHKIHCIPNGAIPPEPLSRGEARHRLGLAPDGIAIAWIGRLSHEKGPDLFIDALRSVRHESVQAVLIGEGPMEPELRREVQRAATAANIVMAGRVEDAGSYLPAFDVLVLSSRTEGSPIVVAEALQLGVPIVAPAVGDLPRLSEHLGIIELATPGGSGDLAEKITGVLQDLPRYRERAERARPEARRIVGTETWMQEISRVYELVIRDLAV